MQPPMRDSARIELPHDRIQRLMRSREDYVRRAIDRRERDLIANQRLDLGLRQPHAEHAA